MVQTCTLLPSSHLRSFPCPPYPSVVCGCVCLTYVSVYFIVLFFLFILRVDQGEGASPSAGAGKTEIEAKFDDKCYTYKKHEYDQYFNHLQRALNYKTIKLLQTHGFVVIDNAFGLENCTSYREEITWLHNQRCMRSNVTAFVSKAQSQPTSQSLSQQQIPSEVAKADPAAGGEDELQEGRGVQIPQRDAGVAVVAPPKKDTKITKLFYKPRCVEAEFNKNEKLLLAAVPRIANVYEKCIPILERKMIQLLPELKLYNGDTSLKVQVVDGNKGAFPYHYDSPGGAKDSRRLSCLLYLNQNWKPEDGGILRLQPFLKPAVDIEPIMDRLVIFYSERLLHRVLPSNNFRSMFTIWLHGTSMEAEEEAERKKQKEEEEKLEKEVELNGRASVQSASSSGGGKTEEEKGKSSEDPTAEAFAQSWSALLEQPSVQRQLSKAIYFEEWKESYQQAHNNGADADLLIQSLEGDVAALRKKEGMPSVLSFLRNLATDAQPIHFDDDHEAYVWNEKPALPRRSLLVDEESSDEEASSTSNGECRLTVKGGTSFMDFL